MSDSPDPDVPTTGSAERAGTGAPVEEPESPASEVVREDEDHAAMQPAEQRREPVPEPGPDAVPPAGDQVAAVAEAVGEPTAYVTMDELGDEPGLQPGIETAGAGTAPAPIPAVAPAPPTPRPGPPIPKPAPPAARPAARPAPGPPAAEPVPRDEAVTASVTPGAPSLSDATPDSTSATVAEVEFGRVAADGTVYVRTPQGDRAVGSWQTDGDAQEALAFFGRRYEDLRVQVELVQSRLSAGSATPEDAQSVAKRVRAALVEPTAIGDLAALDARLAELDAVVAAHREERKKARSAALEEARVAKEAIVEEAEQIAAGTDWRAGADRLRTLLEQWKALPRLDRATDDSLWRRFSTARTHYTRHRKAHFAVVGEQREEARSAKENLVLEAEALATSTDWTETARAYRDLMARWKSAGGAPRAVEDKLWNRFRAAQDTFFGARSATLNERDAEFSQNLSVKQALLVEAEALLPVRNWKAAKSALREIQDRWEAAGKVPRDDLRSVEARLRTVEEAVRTAEESEWTRSNPQAYARASDTATQLEASIADLQKKLNKAQAAGNERGVHEAEQAIAARREWLTQAQKALQEFGG